MNYIFLDYDAEDVLNPQSFENNDEVTVFNIRDIAASEEIISADSKGIIITNNSGGWQRYHSDFVLANPAITHWVVVVASDFPERVRELARKEIETNFERNQKYSELVFISAEDTLSQTIHQILNSSTKKTKNCLILSKNVELSTEISQVLSFYFKDWSVEPCLKPDSPNYEMIDLLIVAGNTLEEMNFPAPNLPIANKLFYINYPLFISYFNQAKMINQMGEMLNENGWDFSDFVDKTFISDLSNEGFLVKILKEEITAASLSSADFAMWNSAGLPVKRTQYTTEIIEEFLKQNCVFICIADRLGALD
ncbi:MAG: hypothetical protein IJJ41_01500 [Clostridia bacterium]|nr:hypothetical protein [Clostridia bacterium]